MHSREADSLAVSLARRYCKNGEGRRLRLEMLLSAREAARALNMSVSQISRWERGLTVPQGERALAYGRLLGLWLQSREAAR